MIGLRKREYCARSPVLDGFDVCASMLRTAEEMFVVRDPDGTVLRFVAGPPTGRARRITEWIEL